MLSRVVCIHYCAFIVIVAKGCGLPVHMELFSAVASDVVDPESCWIPLTEHVSFCIEQDYASSLLSLCLEDHSAVLVRSGVGVVVCGRVWVLGSQNLIEHCAERMCCRQVEQHKVNESKFRRWLSQLVILLYCHHSCVCCRQGSMPNFPPPLKWLEWLWRSTRLVRQLPQVH